MAEEGEKIFAQGWGRGGGAFEPPERGVGWVWKRGSNVKTVHSTNIWEFFPTELKIFPELSPAGAGYDRARAGPMGQFPSVLNRDG